MDLDKIENEEVEEVAPSTPEDEGDIRKPKTKRQYTPEQKEAMRTRMIAINQKRIQDARTNNLKVLEAKEMTLKSKMKVIEEKRKEVAPAKEEPIQKPKKKNIKVIHQLESDSEESSADEIVIVNKRTTKSKPKSAPPPPEEKKVSCRFI